MEFLLAKIEDAILKVLEDASMVDGRNKTLTTFDVSDDLSTINKTPAIAAATEIIDFRVGGSGVTTMIPTIMLYMLFKSVKSKKARRQGIYPIIEAAVQLLAFNELGSLGVEGLKPGKAVEVADEDIAANGMIAFKLPLTTSFEIESDNGDADAAELLKIGISYYLQPGDEVADATDEVDLDESEA